MIQELKKQAAICLQVWCFVCAFHRFKVEVGAYLLVHSVCSVKKWEIARWIRRRSGVKPLVTIVRIAFNQLSLQLLPPFPLKVNRFVVQLTLILHICSSTFLWCRYALFFQRFSATSANHISWPHLILSLVTLCNTYLHCSSYISWILWRCSAGSWVNFKKVYHLHLAIMWAVSAFVLFSSRIASGAHFSGIVVRSHLDYWPGSWNWCEGSNFGVFGCACLLHIFRVVLLRSVWGAWKLRKSSRWLLAAC
jgi:hypothetical protein